MNRKRSQPPGLDLLLDTICNTFGGILFISILVVVLLNISGNQIAGKEGDKPDTVRRAELLNEKRRLKQELNRLESILANTNAIRSAAGSEDRHALAKTLVEIGRQVAELQSQREKLQTELAEEVASWIALEARNEELKTQLEEVSDAVAKTKLRLEEEQDSRTRHTALPELRETDRGMVGVVIKHDQLFVWHDYSSQGYPLGLNTKEFVVVEETDIHVVTAPIPGTGVSLANADSATNVRSRLSRFSPARHAIAAIIYPDSFDTFHVVQKVCTNAGFLVQPWIMAEGVEMLDQGGTERTAQ